MVPLRPDPRYPTTGRVGYNTHCSCDIPSVRPAKKLPARECCAVRKTIRDYKTVSVYNLSFELIFIRILRSRVRCRVWAVWRAPTRPHAHASNAAERASRRSTPHLRQHNSPPRPRTTCDALSARPCARRSSRARSAAQPTSPVYINTKTSLRISRVLTVRPGRKLDRLQPAPVQLPSTGSTIFRPLLGRALQPLGIIDHHGAFARRPGEARR